jgi:hypothetical protein
MYLSVCFPCSILGFVYFVNNVPYCYVNDAERLPKQTYFNIMQFVKWIGFFKKLSEKAKSWLTWANPNG